jgi:hypothetical protein
MGKRLKGMRSELMGFLVLLFDLSFISQSELVQCMEKYDLIDQEDD